MISSNSRHHFIALVWNPESQDEVQASRRLVASLSSTAKQWPVAYRGPTGIVVTSHSEVSSWVHPLGHESGVVIGTLFRTQVEEPSSVIASLHPSEAHRIAARGGQDLIDDYWGSYVAFIFDQSAHVCHVLREPTANFPCYHTRHMGVQIFFSHIGDCIDLLSLSFVTNRHYLTRWLMFSRFLHRECGLHGVEELVGGERWTLRAGAVTRKRVWDPATIAARRRLERPDLAAAELRSTTLRVVGAWASCYEKITHRLSGGLDSSIVAACLATGRSRSSSVNYLNLFIEIDAENDQLRIPYTDRRLVEKMRAIIGNGDERYFARLVAERWGVELIERPRTVSLDLKRMWHAPLMPSPSMYFSSMELDDAEIDLARNRRTEVFFSGQTGDSVFQATIQPLAAIDYAWEQGLRREFWHHVAASAALSKESYWTVLVKALKHGLVRRPYRSPFAITQQPSLLARAALADLAETDFNSPWAEIASGLAPGKQHLVRGLSGSSFHDYVFHSGQYADHVDPLNSQPLWELMLQIPTHTILAGGVSRGLARQAFGDLLPNEIAARLVKGTGTSFYQHVVLGNKGFLRERLLDGELVRDGYLDREQVEMCLASDAPFMRVGAGQILAYLAAEVWIDQFHQVRRRLAA